MAMKNPNFELENMVFHVIFHCQICQVDEKWIAVEGKPLVGYFELNWLKGKLIGNKFIWVRCTLVSCKFPV